MREKGESELDSKTKQALPAFTNLRKSRGAALVACAFNSSTQWEAEAGSLVYSVSSRTGAKATEKSCPEKPKKNKQTNK